jgi:enoyl-CoA hydratase/carnithine racemase
MSVARSERDGVIELTLDRPQRRNAFTTALLRELREHLREASGPVILTGAGEAFCSGADVREPDDRDERFALVNEVLELLRGLAPPTLAAVHGPAIGGGWGLALACDLCFASRAATFCLPELVKGYRLPAPLVRRLEQVVGPVRAAELTLAGTTYDVHDALAAGAVTRIYGSREALLAGARELAKGLT